MVEEPLLARIAVAAILLLVVALLAYFVARSLTERGPKKKTTLPDAIVTAGSVIVSFKANPKKLEAFLLNGGEAGVGRKLQELLAANPRANLKKLADALGIVVTSVQRPNRRPGGAGDGVILGDE